MGRVQPLGGTRASPRPQLIDVAGSLEAIELPGAIDLAIWRKERVEMVRERRYRARRGSQRRSPAAGKRLPGGDVAMAFVQIIEFTTTRPDEVEALVSEWRTKTAGRRTAQRATVTQDRERPNTYVQIVEFPSYEDAMANSNLPETASFAERLGHLCDGPMLFRNLDVRSVEEM